MSIQVESVFDLMITLEARRAFLNHRAHKPNLYQPDYQALEDYILSEDCTADIEAILCGCFEFSIPRQKMLRKSHSTRRRVVFIYAKHENMLLKYLTFMLRSLDSIYSDSLYSFRANRSVRQLFDRIAKHDFAQGLYKVKTDIRDYGHSINQQLLLVKLRELFGESDPTLLTFLDGLITRNVFERDGEVHHGNMGGLPGTPVSSFFNNIYLMELDEYLEAHTVLYSRYADDIALFVESRDEAEQLCVWIGEHVVERKLVLNKEKTQILAPGEPLELLGIGINGRNFDISNNSMDKISTKLVHTADKIVRKERRGDITYDEGMRWMMQRTHRYFFGGGSNENELNWVDWSFGILTRPKSLREIDELVQQLLRYVGSGRRGDARYRVRYSDLKAYGYRSLVHEFYHHRHDAKRELVIPIDENESCATLLR